jgi:hypothetical protein
MGSFWGRGGARSPLCAYGHDIQTWLPGNGHRSTLYVNTQNESGMPTHRRCPWCAHAHQFRGSWFRSPPPLRRVPPWPSLDVDGGQRSPVVTSGKEEAIMNRSISLMLTHTSHS